MPNLPTPPQSIPTRYTPKEFGVPSVPTEFLATGLNGTASGWMPGIRTDINDWLLVRGDGWEWNGFTRGHGDPRRVVLHWMSEDDRLEPFWSNLAKKVEWIRQTGCEKILAIDYSTWSTWPFALQAYNVYRSATINRDLGLAGFKLIPCMKLATPEQQTLFNGYWPDEIDPTTPIAINASHLSNEDINWKMLAATAKYVDIRWPNHLTWVWSNSDAPVKWWREYIGPCQWVPTRNYMQRRVVTARQKLRGS